MKVHLIEHFPLCNHQKVRLPLPSSSPCAKSLRGGIRSHWDTLRHLTQQRLHRGGAFRVRSPAAERPDVKDSSRCSVRRGSYPPTEPLCRAAAAARPRPPPRCQPMSNCQVCFSKSQCRFCYTNLIWEQSLNRSAPSVSSSVLIGKKRSVFIVGQCVLFLHLSSQLFAVFHRLMMSVFSLETTSSKSSTAEMKMKQESPLMVHPRFPQPGGGLCLRRVSPFPTTPT